MCQPCILPLLPSLFPAPSQAVFPSNEHPCRLQQALATSGVDTSLVREVEGPCGTAVILLEHDGG